MRGPANHAAVANLRPVPDDPGHPALADHLAAALVDPSALFDRLRLVVAGQWLRDPDVGVVGVLHAEHDGRVSNVSDVDLAATDEGDAGRCAGGARKPRSCFWPIFWKENKVISNFCTFIILVRNMEPPEKIIGKVNFSLFICSQPEYLNLL